MEKTTDSKMFSEGPKQNGRKLLRLWLTVLGIHLTSVLLGFAVFLIVFGAQLIFIRIIITWLSARKWFTKTLDITITEYDVSNIPSQYASLLSKFHFFIALVHVIVGLYMMVAGIRIFLRDGFLEQNLIYLIFFK